MNALDKTNERTIHVQSVNVKSWKYCTVQMQFLKFFQQIYFIMYLYNSKYAISEIHLTNGLYNVRDIVDTAQQNSF